MQPRTAFLLLPLSAALSAQAPITLTHGPTRFDHNSYSNSTTDIGGYCNFTSSGVDHAYQSSWYYALASDATGSAFNSSGGQLTASVSTDGRTGELLWLNVDQRNFSAVLTNAVYSTGASSGVSAQTMTISNNTGAPLTINVYAYLDLDVNNSAGGDTATQEPSLTAGNHLVTDVITLWHTANGFNNWAVGAYANLRASILAGFGGAPWVPGNAGTPFGPGDYTSVYHWLVTIAPGARQSFETMIADTAMPASQRIARSTTFCNAKTGTNGLPAWALNRAYIGSTANLTIENGFPGSAPIVLLGTAPALIQLPPFGTICTVSVTTINMPAFSAARSSTLPCPIPALSSMGGQQLHFQGFFVDPGAAGSVAHTDGLTWTFGNYHGN